MKRALTVIFVLLLVGLGAALVLSNLPQTLPDSDLQTMRVADQLYQTGQYVQAAQMYRSLAERGTTNATLYYNLGTAYLQSGDVGSAILYLRRAQMLAPRDADIESNLALARSRLLGTAPAATITNPEQVVKMLDSWLTVNEMAALSVGLWIAFTLLLIATRRMEASGARRFLRTLMVLAAIALIVVGVGFGARFYLHQSQTPAVIVASQANLGTEPGESGTGLTLRGGEEVHMLNERGDWVQILLPESGAQGWVAKSAVAEI